MLAVYPPNFMVGTRIIYGYNFVAYLNIHFQRRSQMKKYFDIWLDKMYLMYFINRNDFHD